MKFSFQTVWIIFGVTLAHLFVISALSPVGGARRDAISRADPAVLSKKKIESAVVVSDSKADSGVVVEKDSPEPSLAETSQERVPAAAATTAETFLPGENSEEQGVATDKRLVETGIEQDSPAAVDPPALSSPPQRIREIRDLKPVRRS